MGGVKRWEAWVKLSEKNQRVLWIKLHKVTVIDEKALNECLNEITRALIQSEVSFPLVKEMHSNIKKIVNLEELAAGLNKRRIIEQVLN